MEERATPVKLFCEQCAPSTRRLTYDQAALPRAELMSGSCMWSDEIAKEWCIECIWRTREVFHLRYSMTVGDAIPPEAMEKWQALEREFPNWPLFRPERRLPELAEQVRHMVTRNRREASVALERLCRDAANEQA